MYISRMQLDSYRNLETLDLRLHQGTNIFFGDNAQGKTNFLESVYLCATGRSHRTSFDRELIMLGKNECHVRAFVTEGGFSDQIDIHLRSNKKKGIAVNNLPIKKLGDLFGILLVVIFSPEDLSLIKSGPSERRRFIDMELCQLNKVYYHNLNKYHKVLKQRNALLKSLAKDLSQADTLDIWDEQLVDYGTRIMSARLEFLERINSISREIHKNITRGKEELRLIYRPNVEASEFLKKLKKNHERDILTKTTNAGIHKDDFSVFINELDARTFGSQGQQRTCSLSLKLAEIKLIKEEKGNTPVLLLDDVLSELDNNRQEYLLKSISDIQTIITGTGVESFVNTEGAKIFSVCNGLISAL